MEHKLAVQLAQVRDARGKHLAMLAWGDPVEVVADHPDRLDVRIMKPVVNKANEGSIEVVPLDGTISKKPKGGSPKIDRVVEPASESRVLKVDFVDVQQGDGAVVETPRGKVLLVDGGELKLFARYLASRFRGTRRSRPRKVDAIVVTHGDVDHFKGLLLVHDSEEHPEPHKRIFIHPKRIFHNGLVPRSGDPKDADKFGATAEVDGRKVVTDLVEDLRDLADAKLSATFADWKKVIGAWAERGRIDMRRLDSTTEGAFKFLEGEDIEVEVLGPITVKAGRKLGLPLLGTPRRVFGHPSQKPTTRFGSPSASHTINGHSVVLRLKYHDVRVLLAGDLNEESELKLLAAHEAKTVDLRSEVLKVPHHGSADFDPGFLAAVNPIVSVVSSGDENEAKEHIHPRATLMSGLGKVGRDPEPVVFVTELVAFFTAEGKAPSAERRPSPFYAFSREQYGMVSVRTDGRHLFVYTGSGKADAKEAYLYEVGKDGHHPRPIARV
ncbi:MAG TPA: MBL fold metallo-hydrolase [Solirubrobacteraceae bacterium]|nr:MBL fold metallo-hydrolase [Solirubrobacteraceae bacterium]